MTTLHQSDESDGKDPWLIYGANGYTGKLIAREAVRRGMKPILAGRSEQRIWGLAEELECDYRIFSLDSIAGIQDALKGVKVVLHCAGPFSRTAEPMVRACIEAGIDYADIDGEIPVLERIYTRHEEAVAAGVTLLPGSGYDVVPTDCLSAMLHETLPDATRLRIAFAGKISQSPGTWNVTLETIPNCGTIRRDAQLVTVPHAWKIEHIDFDDRRRCTMSIPWGDVSSAFRSTGIPNIHVAIGVPCLSAFIMRMVRRPVCALLRIPTVLRLMESVVPRFIKGPSERTRHTVIYHLRGDVWNAAGEQRSLCMQTPEGYTCTVESTIAIVERLRTKTLPHGALTPSRAMGSEFALSLPGISLVDCP